MSYASMFLKQMSVAAAGIAVFVFLFFPFVIRAILPGCIPGTTGCQQATPDAPQDTGSGMGEGTDGTQGLPGTSEGAGQQDGTSSVGSDTSSGSGALPSSSSGSLDLSEPSGSLSSPSSAPSSHGGASLTGGEGVSLRDVITTAPGQELEQETVPVFSAQCDLIVEGVRFFDDDDADGLVQLLGGLEVPGLYQEDFYQTDPANPDTDYDSYFDGEEACSGYDPLNPPVISPVDYALVNRLKGHILLQVERNGEAWYMYPSDGLRYYLRNGEIAYIIMRFFSLGITNADLEKIPVGIEPRFEDADADSDRLSDKMEEGLGTDPLSADTDNDGVGDGDEVLVYSTHPLREGRLVYSPVLVSRLLGKILLQVESRGEAWYVHPADGKRYYMKDGASAYQIMRFLSLGTSNRDLNKLPIGSLRGKIGR